jgi:hypothetical protein
MTKQMKETSTNIIELDKAKIDEKIAESGEYTSEGIFIKKWSPHKEENEEEQENPSDKKEENKYISTLEKNGFQYSGSLNDKFKRDGYGLEIFNNGDKYFGQYDSDLRNENGIYYYASTKDNENENPDNIQTECYLGQWKNNVKDRNGIYIWMDEPENNFEFDNANFDAYVGEFEEEKYLRGTYLSKLKNEYYLYHGNFDKEGKKSDDNAYFFTSKSNKIFHGKVIKDVLQNGYLGSIDEEGETVKDIVYCKFNEDGSVNDVIEEKRLNAEEIEDEKRNIVNFRTIIFDGDYYGKIYNKFKKIKNKIDKLGDMVSVLEGEESIAEINKILNKYSKKNIYFDIEENFFGREM